GRAGGAIGVVVAALWGHAAGQGGPFEVAVGVVPVAGLAERGGQRGRPPVVAVRERPGRAVGHGAPGEQAGGVVPVAVAGTAPGHAGEPSRRVVPPDLLAGRVREVGQPVRRVVAVAEGRAGAGYL